MEIHSLFKPKFPTVTYAILAINIIVFLVPLLYGQSEEMIAQFCVHGPSIRFGQYYRLFTGMFLHGSIFHIIFNCYALYILGSQIESFIGKFKYLIIYILGGIMGSLFSITFNGTQASVGASGAIFGLMGALVYFGYHYRVYLGHVVKTQIVPLIVFNLVLGFAMAGVDNSAHIGGLIGGTLATIALGIKDKSTNFERVNGLITLVILFAFAIYMAFVYAV